MKTEEQKQITLSKTHFLSKKREGLTLIEATIVLFIIGLLMLLILPNLSNQREHAKETHRKAMAAAVQTQIDLYLNDHPDQSNVNLDQLESNGYLSSEQVNKVNDLDITVQGRVAKFA
ncbi:competence protein ComGC [Fructobacillus sp. M2-14]|uniref:Competence protein ComGC n=1 Tax=Fructobacillus broussonetiae TaxID=2713173 RepID=A0ABS5QZW6_9LACO|nr:prepilin-type N-terminal cleavage/methylation domain-containing protein [Fructobacillus broussonetiae]MBS9338753.1 competence protein ComGC [Fructobacillus broussonetiae]